ncbi:MAG TPA: hypothetical protein VF792_10205 [Ktedonobacterales bacterium]
MVTQDVGHPAIRYGVIFGLLLGLLGVGVAIAQWQTGAFAATTTMSGGEFSLHGSGSGAPLGWDCAHFLALLALTGVAGALASRRTARIHSGVFAGLLAGALGAFISGGAAFTVIFDQAARHLNPSQTAAFGQTNASLSVGLATLIVAGGVGIVGAVSGLLMGTLAGLIGAAQGRAMAPIHPASYTPYTSIAPGQPDTRSRPPHV